MKKKNMIVKEKRGEIYKKITDFIPDAELIDIKINNDD